MLLFLKNLLFTVLVPGTVGVIVPVYVIGHEIAVSGLTSAVAVGLLGIGAAIYAWCVWDFASFGRGTPAPIDAPKKLVVRGLYRYSRNPMYVGVLTVILGWTVLYLSPRLLVYAMCVGTAFQAFIRFYEEPYLEGEFGEEYRRYKSRVGRWLLPPEAPPVD